jgi:hypothetical protein
MTYVRRLAKNQFGGLFHGFWDSIGFALDGAFPLSRWWRRPGFFDQEETAAAAAIDAVTFTREERIRPFGGLILEALRHFLCSWSSSENLRLDDRVCVIPATS